ncbi:hypothetical protein DPMN_168905 [Dreissena polymorpha]|uniref:Uncharacterized protein n=1 Tax=Dreissena polymorpha TaxID=45954 RepID=A0A9D4J027_DREPO|nr:hypothetical protein DPMN_168905 [Dreissena polymorpha]
MSPTETRVSSSHHKIPNKKNEWILKRIFRPNIRRVASSSILQDCWDIKRVLKWDNFGAERLDFTLKS